MKAGTSPCEGGSQPPRAGEWPGCFALALCRLIQSGQTTVSHHRVNCLNGTKPKGRECAPPWPLPPPISLPLEAKEQGKEFSSHEMWNISEKPLGVPTTSLQQHSVSVRRCLHSHTRKPSCTEQNASLPLFLSWLPHHGGFSGAETQR